MTERIQNFKIYHPPSSSIIDDENQKNQQKEYLILIHGLNGNLLTWTPTLAPTLAKSTGKIVITFDQPCYGRNPVPFKHIDELVLENNSQDSSATKEKLLKDSTQAMLTQLEDIMRPSNLAIELHKLLSTLGVIPCSSSSSCCGLATTENAPDAPLNSCVIAVPSLREERKYYCDNKIKPFLHIFGQSFGGKTACCFADRYPHLTASLALGDIGICPCSKYTIDTARQLAANFYVHHLEFWPDEQSVTNYVHSVFGGEGGDDVGKKYDVAFDAQERAYRSLVRPHVGFIHDFLSRKCDLRDAWADFEGPVCVFRAGDSFTCLSDDEWRLMKSLRRKESGQDKNTNDDDDDDHANVDLFVTPSADGHHGVYRSHPELFISIYSDFLRKVVRK